ncbi:hypothetical protein ACLMJK_001520 [Lecanora helva]
MDLNMGSFKFSSLSLGDLAEAPTEIAKNMLQVAGGKELGSILLYRLAAVYFPSFSVHLSLAWLSFALERSIRDLSIAKDDGLLYVHRSALLSRSLLKNLGISPHPLFQSGEGEAKQTAYVSHLTNPSQGTPTATVSLIWYCALPG